MSLTFQLLVLAVLMQAFIGVAFALIQSHIAEALVNIAFGLRSRLGQLRSARW